MGNNEPLLPPPPPGQPPQGPQGPQGPQYQPPPQYPPTQQMPPTSGYPQQGYPQQGYAPAGYGPGGPPPSPPKKKTGLIIGGVVAAAALVGGVIVLAGGDDDESPSIVADTTLLSTVAPTVATTAAPSDTLVITLPESTAPPMTTPPVDTTTASPDAGFIEVTDDTLTFTVMMPDMFEYDTTETEIGGFIVPNVTGAESIDGYYSDDDTLGFSVLAFGAGDLTSAELLEGFSPADGVCGAPRSEIGYPTALGPADMLMFDDCGVASESAKVIIALPLPGFDFVLLAYGQGLEPAEDSILIITLYVLESIIVT